MGVIVNDTTTLPSGLEISGYYASLGNTGEVVTYKHQISGISKFLTRGTILWWANKDARLSDKPPVHTEYISVTSDTAPTGSAYQLIYDKFKEELTNFTDDL